MSFVSLSFLFIFDILYSAPLIHTIGPQTIHNSIQNRKCFTFGLLFPAQPLQTCKGERKKQKQKQNGKVSVPWCDVTASMHIYFDAYLPHSLEFRKSKDWTDMHICLITWPLCSCDTSFTVAVRFDAWCCSSCFAPRTAAGATDSVPVSWWVLSLKLALLQNIAICL